MYVLLCVLHLCVIKDDNGLTLRNLKQITIKVIGFRLNCCIARFPCDSTGFLSILQVPVTIGQTGMEGCLKEISESPADNNPRLARLESDILRYVDVKEADSVVRRRGVVVCDSDEVADALLHWMKRSFAALRPTKLNLPSRHAQSGE